MKRQRQRINLTVDKELCRKARAKHFVISRVLDDALRELVQEDEPSHEEESQNNQILDRVNALNCQIEKIETKKEVLMDILKTKNSHSESTLDEVF